eukprot:810636-Amphidinium_carterae.2
MLALVVPPRFFILGVELYTPMAHWEKALPLGADLVDRARSLQNAGANVETKDVAWQDFQERYRELRGSCKRNSLVTEHQLSRIQLKLQRKRLARLGARTLQTLPRMQITMFRQKWKRHRGSRVE